MYPIVETVHVLGLCLFVRTACLWDLQVAEQPDVARRFGFAGFEAHPCHGTAVGFAIMAVSDWGSPFWNRCGSTRNIFFRIKLVLPRSSWLERVHLSQNRRAA